MLKAAWATMRNLQSSALVIRVGDGIEVIAMIGQIRRHQNILHYSVLWRWIHAFDVGPAREFEGELGRVAVGAVIRVEKHINGQSSETPVVAVGKRQQQLAQNLFATMHMRR